MKSEFLLFCLCLLFVANTYGQVKFERGYFINNENKRIDCFIKNYDRERTPGGIEYRLIENGVSAKYSIDSIKEFGIKEGSKFIRSAVKIDRSSNEITSLSKQRNPLWSDEQLFLKVLIEGKATLYQYREVNFERYFYSVSGSQVQQLIYKQYYLRKDTIAYNFNFRQQLWNDLRIKDQPESSVESINYNQKELYRYFAKFNGAGPGNQIVQIKDTKIRNLFFLRLTPGVNHSSLMIDSPYQNNWWDYSDKCLNLRMGFELGIIMPYNKNKLALLVEPSFVSFKTESTDMKVNYSAIEFPIGARYFFFLNKNAKLFVNAFYVSSLKIYFDRQLELSKDIGVGRTYEKKTMPGRNCIAFGAGADYRKISFEFRFYMKSLLFDQYSDWTTNSFIFGYQIF